MDIITPSVCKKAPLFIEALFYCSKIFWVFRQKEIFNRNISCIL